MHNFDTLSNLYQRYILLKALGHPKININLHINHESII